MMKIRSRSIGALVLGVASITRLPPVAAAVPPAADRPTPRAGRHASRRDRVGACAGDRYPEGGTVSWAIPPVPPELDLAARAVGLQHGVQQLQLHLGDVAAALLTVERRRPELDPAMSIANPATYTMVTRRLTVSLKSSYKCRTVSPSPPTTCFSTST